MSRWPKRWDKASSFCAFVRKLDLWQQCTQAWEDRWKGVHLLWQDLSNIWFHHHELSLFLPLHWRMSWRQWSSRKKRAKLSSRKSLDHSLFACYFRFHLILWNSFLIQMFSKSIASSCFLIGSAPHNEPLCCLLALDRLKPYLSFQNFIYSLCKILFIVGHRWWDQPPENTSVYIQLKPL